MLTAIIAAVVILFLAVFLFLARRALRLFVRLAMAGVLVLLGLLIVVAWWWYRPAGAPSTQTTNRPAATRHAPSR